VVDESQLRVTADIRKKKSWLFLMFKLQDMHVDRLHCSFGNGRKVFLTHDLLMLRVNKQFNMLSHGRLMKLCYTKSGKECIACRVYIKKQTNK
jgi:hypothetical protein